MELCITLESSVDDFLRLAYLCQYKCFLLSASIFPLDFVLFTNTLQYCAKLEPVFESWNSSSTVSASKSLVAVLSTSRRRTRQNVLSFFHHINLYNDNNIVL